MDAQAGEHERTARSISTDGLEDGNVDIGLLQRNADVGLQR
jgi:hypothetical protein